ncbi:hypothetical protein B0H14DRAFT_3865790 [Mycena olivaceomarginata]|nr:hypothetical protein B0H14DRAFT_3865790 [Mycena olivaceomarginata]
MASFFQLLSGTLGLRLAESAPAAIVNESPTALPKELSQLYGGYSFPVMRADNELRSSLHLIKNIRIVKTLLVPAAPAIVKTDTEKGAEAESP